MEIHCPVEVQGQAEHMREALKEEEQLLIITRLHQVRAGVIRNITAHTQMLHLCRPSIGCRLQYYT